MSYLNAIILCTKNGMPFLKKQLESIFNQTEKKFDLYINDDGSDDETINILENFKLKYPQYNIKITHLKYGCSNKNFIETLKQVPNCYLNYFFCDQDDIWMAEKIEVSAAAIKPYKNIPSVFCSRTSLIDVNDNFIGMSPNFKEPPSFGNALVQSIAGGNTMCFNLKTKLILDKVITDDLPAHDWITYILVSAHNGKIIYSQKPYVLYREHKNNQIGPNQGLIAKMKRAIQLFRGEFKLWVRKNLEILNNFKLSDENSVYVDLFVKKIHNGKLYWRVIYFFKLNIHRQGFLPNLLLFFAVLFKKI